MSLASEPESLTCAACGDEFEEGYLPAVDRDGEWGPLAEAAVCLACGFNEVGYAGCAPEVGDLVDDEDGTVLLHVDAGGDGTEVRSVKE